MVIDVAPKSTYKEDLGDEDAKHYWNMMTSFPLLGRSGCLSPLLPEESQSGRRKWTKLVPAERREFKVILI
ncbi:Uncharacterized protein APZ42_008726 [Daphnia magna]|uniref:Uncharacterized protein n=1 Tax=Daphnia magna TaxID=35525 RepID=A0A164EG54_9CRUS|nr:Uncharacterized protein APZ42_008726 [Daphnia magna]